MDNQRFDRLESKIDKLTDAITKIVRVEEQIASNNRRVDMLEERVSVHSKDIRTVAEIARSNQAITKFADKLFWLFAAAFVSYGFYLFK